MKKKILIYLLGCMVPIVSCKKFIEIDAPLNQLLTKSVFEDESTATATVIGIYSRMMDNDSFLSSQKNLTTICGLSADELDNYSPDINDQQVFNNSLNPTNTTIDLLWNIEYQYIYTANAAIEGINNSSKISTAKKSQLLGEVYFIRAFCYFYLVNLFGDIPYQESTDYRVNTLAPRTPKATIYKHIIKDLLEAKSLLSSDYSVSNGERIRPNKFAAAALLARVYLYTQDWSKAENESTSIIENVSLYDLASVTLNDVFLKNSKESIWQLAPVVSGFNTDQGRYLILTSTPTIIALSDNAYNAFEINDPRRNLWISNITSSGKTYRYPYKYKIKANSIVTEYNTILRLAEQYLIRSEARVHQNNIVGAIADINIIRKRARGNSLTVLADLSLDISKPDLLTAVYKERQLELFCEWGQRWLDLKRTDLANIIMKPIKGSNWNIEDIQYPIPQKEMLNNPNMVQNTGYQ